MKKSHSAVNHIIEFITRNPKCSSADIFQDVAETVSLATVKRVLRQILIEGLIISQGQGKATRYSISPAWQLIGPVDVDAYFQQEIDQRVIITAYNQDLIQDVLKKASLFTTFELQHLSLLHDGFTKRIAALSADAYRMELERLAIDLSWKSSQIEGNTYSLLETERLLREKVTAAGKTKDEAVMLLNHKTAIDFITEHSDYVHPLRLSAIEDIHQLLVDGLNIERNIRRSTVGISGTNYKPPYNEHQIREALTEMCLLINERINIFEKALLALALISYIQPFADGNKRTARIISNAILMHHRHCPLSFRTVDSMDYKKAMLIFYEQNKITAIKKIFISQYEFAVNTYF